MGQAYERLFREDLERRAVRRPREMLAELVELAQDREIARRKIAGPLEPREGVGVHDSLDDGLGREGRAFLLDPCQPPYPLELLGKPALEREEMQHVGLRVAALSLGKRAARPVVTLPRRRQLDAEIGPEQHVESERLVAQEASRDRGVEERREAEPPALELDQVVVTGVQDRDDRRRREYRRERPQVAERDGIDEPDVAGRHRQLDQREALRIVMEAVAFRVESDLAGRHEALRDLREVGDGLDPVGPVRGDGPRPGQAFVSRTACSSRSCRRRSASRPSS